MGTRVQKPTNRRYMKRESKLEVSISNKAFPLEIREPPIEERNIVRVIGDEGHQENTAQQNQLSRVHTASQRLKPGAWGLHGSAPSPLCVMVISSVFVELLTVGAGISLTLLPAFGTFPSIVLPC